MPYNCRISGGVSNLSHVVNAFPVSNFLWFMPPAFLFLFSSRFFFLLSHSAPLPFSVMFYLFIFLGLVCVPVGGQTLQLLRLPSAGMASYWFPVDPCLAHLLSNSSSPTCVFKDSVIHSSSHHAPSVAVTCSDSAYFLANVFFVFCVLSFPVLDSPWCLNLQPIA